MLKSRKSKTEKGITLIALIITIVVLLILAVVAITAITNDGIISKAQNVAQKYNEAQQNEQEKLDIYEGVFEAEKAATTFEEATKSAMLVKNVNSIVYDEYGNKIVVPAGFKIRVDEGERTKGDAKSTATHVTEGIVIEDASGNQFVWVPVGNIKESTTDTTGKTITLGRYSNFTATDGVYTPDQTASNYATPTTIISYFTEYTTGNGNAKARNLKDFCESVIGVNGKEGNGGYYIGRFEAGVVGYDETATTNNTQASGNTEWTKYVKADGSNPTLVCRANQQVWNNITQKKASGLSKNMYANGYKNDGTGTFSSDLINSYAWDTAIVFIQTFGGEDASSYYDDNNSTSFTTTGENRDEYCNINDMSENATEWSTETSSIDDRTCVVRGGYYNPGSGEIFGFTRGRAAINTTGYNVFASFRPLLYVGL